MPLRIVRFKFNGADLPSVELIYQELISHTNLEVDIKSLGSCFMFSCPRFWSPVEVTLGHKNKEIHLVSGTGLLSPHPYLVWITGFILIRLGGECDGFNPPTYVLTKWKDLKWWESAFVLI